MSDRKTAGQPTEKKTGQSAEISSRKRRSGISIMGQLIGLVTPLLPVMLLAIVLGTIVCDFPYNCCGIRSDAYSAGSGYGSPWAAV